MQYITIKTVQDIIEKAQLAYPKTDVVKVISGSEISIDDVLTTSVEETV